MTAIFAKLKLHWLYPAMSSPIIRSQHMAHKAFMLAFALAATVPSIAFAAQSASPISSAESAVPKGLLRSTVAPTKLNSHERTIAGVWVSMDTTRGAAAGTMVLNKDRHLTLQLMPIATVEIPAMEGTWSADGKVLVLEVPDRGQSRSTYVVSDDAQSLEVTYSNGMAQIFFREDATIPRKPVIEAHRETVPASKKSPAPKTAGTASDSKDILP